MNYQFENLVFEGGAMATFWNCWKCARIESGRQGVERYFAWYDTAVKQAA